MPPLRPRPPPFLPLPPVSAPLPLPALPAVGASPLLLLPSSHPALRPSRRPCFGGGPVAMATSSPAMALLPLVAGSRHPSTRSTTLGDCCGRSGLDAATPPGYRAALFQAQWSPPPVALTPLAVGFGSFTTGSDWRVLLR
jgi:hypothetical protein